MPAAAICSSLRQYAKCVTCAGTRPRTTPPWCIQRCRAHTSVLLPAPDAPMHAVCAPHAFAPQQPIEGSAIGCSAIILLLLSSAYRTQGGRAAPLPGPKARSPGFSYVQARSAHQPAAPAKARDVVQDRQPAAIFGGNTEAQTPELDVAWGRIHAQARTVLPGRPLRGPSVQAFHDLVRTGQAAKAAGPALSGTNPTGALQSCSPYSPQLVSLLSTTALWPNQVF